MLYSQLIYCYVIKRFSSIGYSELLFWHFASNIIPSYDITTKYVTHIYHALLSSGLKQPWHSPPATVTICRNGSKQQIATYYSYTNTKSAFIH